MNHQNPILFIVTVASVFILSTIGITHTAIADDAPKPSEKAAKVLSKYERTGEMVTCLNLRTIREIRALDDRHFLVRTGGSEYYLNVTSNRCSGASRANNRIQYTTSIARLCRNEIIRVIDNTTGILSGSCGLSDFERLKKKPPEKDAEDDVEESDG